MFGKKAARIRELEAQLDNAMENLLVAEMPVGMGKLIAPAAHIVSKGEWYQVRYNFRANDARSFDIAELFIARAASQLDNADPTRYTRFVARESR